jgi:hypothetical protein
LPGFFSVCNVLKARVVFITARPGFMKERTYDKMVKYGMKVRRPCPTVGLATFWSSPHPVFFVAALSFSFSFSLPFVYASSVSLIFVEFAG